MDLQQISKPVPFYHFFSYIYLSMAGFTEDLGAPDSWEVTDLEESMNHLNLILFSNKDSNSHPSIDDASPLPLSLPFHLPVLRRLRVQQQIRSVKKVVTEVAEEETNEMPDIPSSIPFLLHVKLIVTVSGAKVQLAMAKDLEGAFFKRDGIHSSFTFMKSANINGSSGNLSNGSSSKISGDDSKVESPDLGKMEGVPILRVDLKYI
ncbi:hypothetical protein RJT34_12111 [Clitoria ternatea]|uniref:Uncharacterized protein n=1 Tax=Clitoria ternatea TaxID=43366 RepID=A0AAN9PJ13_CLITE